MTEISKLTAALAEISHIVVETIEETPDGVPGGILYTALMPFMGLDSFERLMSCLVELKKVRKVGQLYFAVAK
jgi:hypothetical protein